MHRQSQVVQRGSQYYNNLGLIGCQPVMCHPRRRLPRLAQMKPLDRQLILDEARGKRLIVTLEESVVTGGFGTGVLELVEEARLADPAYRDLAVRILGIPGERFVDHGSVADLRRVLRLDADGLAGQVREALEMLRATPGRSGSEVAAG